MPFKGNKIRIAVADDHKIVRDSINFTINYHAKERMELVIAVDNGRELVRQLRKKKVDILILDLQMPDIKGEETCEILIKKFPELKIIIFTFHRGWDEADGLIKAGARGFMTKDYGYEHILESIDAVMKGEVYLRNPSINYHEQVPENKKLVFIQRERSILELLNEGLRTIDIADKLKLSKRTIEEHKTRMYKRSDTKNSADLLRHARILGWLK